LSFYLGQSPSLNDIWPTTLLKSSGFVRRSYTTALKILIFCPFAFQFGLCPNWGWCRIQLKPVSPNLINMNKFVLKNLADEALPENLHNKIMRKILLIKFRNVAILTGIFLVINLWFIVDKIIANASENQAVPVMLSFLKELEFSVAYFKVLLSVSTAVLPWGLMLFALVNIVLSSYIFRVYQKEF
jgi:hypothetical protein